LIAKKNRIDELDLKDDWNLKSNRQSLFLFFIHANKKEDGVCHPLF